jgi:DNA-directed RNA polymerase sigma subunit (sigma70/sigma32)
MFLVEKQMVRGIFMNISSDDATEFLDMIGSWRGPSYEPKLGKKKPYYAFLKDRESDKYQRFMEVYQAFKGSLSESEQFILDRHYGIDAESAPLHKIGNELHIGSERVRQIKFRAEYRLATEIAKRLK